MRKIKIDDPYPMQTIKNQAIPACFAGGLAFSDQTPEVFRFQCGPLSQTGLALKLIPSG